MKLNISREWTEQKNDGNAHCIYAIRVSNGPYPLLLSFLMFLFCALGDMTDASEGERTTKYLTPNENSFQMKNVCTCTVLKYTY